jgi:hypothetical protein
MQHQQQQALNILGKPYTHSNESQTQLASLIQQLALCRRSVWTVHGQLASKAI